MTRSLTRIFHTLSSRDAARARLARRAKRFGVGLYGNIPSVEEREANAARRACSKSQQKGDEISGLRGRPLTGSGNLCIHLGRIWHTCRTTESQTRVAHLKRCKPAVEGTCVHELQQSRIVPPSGTNYCGNRWLNWVLADCTSKRRTPLCWDTASIAPDPIASRRHWRSMRTNWIGTHSFSHV